MVHPSIHGSTDPRFSRVREAFADNFATHNELGAAVAVVIGGRVVVDLWGGFADESRTRAWERDTLVNVFSVGKGVLALGALMLVERGLLHLDAPVARYWPEFAAAGKEAITVRELLSHRAGLPAVREVLEDGAIYDWSRMTTALAAQAPWWPPGTRHGYHVNTFGFLVGELLRRISGKSPGAFLKSELTGPVSADFLVGVGEDDDRRIADFIWNPELAEVPTPDRSILSDAHLMMLHTYFNPRGASGHGTVNTTAWRRAEYPSTNGHATALGIAKTYAVVAGGGVAGGRRLVGRELLEEAAREHSAGEDAVLGRPSRFGLGFQLAPLERPIGPNPGVVLHFGAGGALGFADPVAEIGFGYAMNRMGPRLANPTNRSLVEAVYACL
ncbi:MAG: serine hydrolase domain-containing protein [Candidatus Binatia bacterium]